MTDLNDFNSPWYSLLSRVKKGQRVELSEVEDLLNSPHPVIEEAKPFIIRVLTGEHKFPRGTKPNRALPKSHVQKDMFTHFLVAIKEKLESNPEEFNEGAFKEIASNVHGKLISPLVGAKQIMAELHYVDVRSVENIMKEAGLTFRSIKK